MTYQAGAQPLTWEQLELPFGARSLSAESRTVSLTCDPYAEAEALVANPSRYLARWLLAHHEMRDDAG